MLQVNVLIPSPYLYHEKGRELYLSFLQAKGCLVRSYDSKKGIFVVVIENTTKIGDTEEGERKRLAKERRIENGVIIARANGEGTNHYIYEKVGGEERMAGWARLIKVGEDEKNWEVEGEIYPRFRLGYPSRREDGMVVCEVLDGYRSVGQYFQLFDKQPKVPVQERPLPVPTSDTFNSFQGWLDGLGFDSQNIASQFGVPLPE